MDNKELIINNVIKMIEAEGCTPKDITIRGIAARCGISVGLINYHFSSKDDLINIAVERIISGIVSKFEEVRDIVNDMLPIDRLEYLGNMTFDYLFEHYEISRISIMSDIANQSLNDNTMHTYMAYIPIIKDIKSSADELYIKQLAFELVFTMQQSFLRSDIILSVQGIDLKDARQRHIYHRSLIRQILGE